MHLLDWVAIQKLRSIHGTWLRGKAALSHLWQQLKSVTVMYFGFDVAKCTRIEGSLSKPNAMKTADVQNVMSNLKLCSAFEVGYNLGGCSVHLD